jgi:hypothetical protein
LLYRFKLFAVGTKKMQRDLISKQVFRICFSLDLHLLYMAEERMCGVIIFSGVEVIADMVQAITKAVETARQNKAECEEVASVSAVVHASRPAMATDPAMRVALEDLAVSLQRALELVRECEQKRTFGRLVGARDLRRVQDDVARKVTLGIFASNVHLQASNVQCAPPPPVGPAAWSLNPAPPQPMPWPRPPSTQEAPWPHKPPSMADFCCPSNWPR